MHTEWVGCLKFIVIHSPVKLSGSEVRPLFVLYQLLEAARDTHDRGLHLGDITLSHLFVDDALYLSLLPCISDSLIKPEPLHSQVKDVNDEGSWLLGEGTITPEAVSDFSFRKLPDNDQPSLGCPSSNNFSATHSRRLAEYERRLSSEDVYNVLKQVSWLFLHHVNIICSMYFFLWADGQTMTALPEERRNII